MVTESRSDKDCTGRDSLPVPGNIHYRHSRDFPYSPLQLFIHCGHNVTFVLQKNEGQSDSTPVNPRKESWLTKGSNSENSLNTRRVRVLSKALPELVQNSAAD